MLNYKILGGLSDMITVQIRKQGGAAIMTIPANVLKQLDIAVGATLEISFTKEGFIAHPTKRKRLTVKELLHGATLKRLKALIKETKWAREGKPIGRELI
jgi:antitoxin ChpS